MTRQIKRYCKMNDSEEDQNSFTYETPADVPYENKRGRPAGKAHSTKRYRRTAQEISDDKLRIAQLRLDALRESEERKLSNTKSRSKPSRAKAVVEESDFPKAPKKVVLRDGSPSPKRLPIGNRRQALYDSWFPSSPRTRY